MTLSAVARAAWGVGSRGPELADELDEMGADVTTARPRRPGRGCGAARGPRREVDLPNKRGVAAVDKKHAVRAVKRIAKRDAKNAQK